MPLPALAYAMMIAPACLPLERYAGCKRVPVVSDQGWRPANPSQCNNNDHLVQRELSFSLSQRMADPKEWVANFKQA